MRPKKVVLVVCSNEDELGRRKFVLETRGFAVLIATSAESAIETIMYVGSGMIDALVTDRRLREEIQGDELCRKVKGIQPGIMTMMMASSVNEDNNQGADVYMPKACQSPAEIEYRLKILCQRKRGPKRSEQRAAQDMKTA